VGTVAAAAGPVNGNAADRRRVFPAPARRDPAPEFFRPIGDSRSLIGDGTRGLTAPGRTGVVLGFSPQESLRTTSDMALKIRLTKVGSVHQPLYRVAVAEARSRRDGAPVEIIGTYRPGDKGSPIKLNLERVEYWLSKGARPTNTMHAMIKKARRAAGAPAAPAAT